METVTKKMRLSTNDAKHVPKCSKNDANNFPKSADPRSGVLDQPSGGGLTPYPTPPKPPRRWNPETYEPFGVKSAKF